LWTGTIILTFGWVISASLSKIYGFSRTILFIILQRKRTSGDKQNQKGKKNEGLLKKKGFPAF
jgi:hypothetical protein